MLPPPPPSHSLIRVQDANEALSNLIKICTQSDDPDPLTRLGVPIRDNQRVLLDENVHLVVLDLLSAPFGVSLEDARGLGKGCTTPRTPRGAVVDLKVIHSTWYEAGFSLAQDTHTHTHRRWAEERREEKDRKPSP